MIYIHNPIESPGSSKSPQAARVFRPGRKFSHLVADSSIELRAYAGKIGLPISWLQNPGRPDEHFDVTGMVLVKIQRDQRVKKIDLFEFGQLMVEKRARAQERAKRAQQLRENLPI